MLCYEVKIEEGEKAGSHWELIHGQDTSGSSHQYVLLSLFSPHTTTSEFLYLQHEANCSEHLE